MTAPLTYDGLMAFAPPSVEISYTPKEVILYALAVGAGADLPGDAALPYVYERGLVPLASFYSILCWPDHSLLSGLGIDFGKLVHGGEALEILEPAAPHGTVTVHLRVNRALDRGPGKGLIVDVVSEVRAKGDGRLLARSTASLFAMGDGGLPGAPMAEPQAVPPLPGRPADGVIAVATRPDQAALYRLCADMNPIHIDPEAARGLGLPKPLLHGLATLGICVQALTRLQPDARITGIETRFRAPVFPGDTLNISYWREGGTIRFEARVEDRLVLSGGAIAIAVG